MPPVSEKQRRLMWWARNNPKEAAKRGLKPSVAKEFTEADPGGALPEKKSKRQKLYDHASSKARRAS
jgi:hypothetical protein